MGEGEEEQGICPLEIVGAAGVVVAVVGSMTAQGTIGTPIWRAYQQHGMLSLASTCVRACVPPSPYRRLLACRFECIVFLFLKF